VAMCVPHLQAAGRLPEQPSAADLEWAGALVELFRDHLRYAAEIVPLSDMFFGETPEPDEEGRAVLAEPTVPAVLDAFRRQAETTAPEEFLRDRIQAMIKAVQAETGARGKTLFMPIRVALTGQTHGPDLAGCIQVLGRDKTLRRLGKTLEKLGTAGA